MTSGLVKITALLFLLAFCVSGMATPLSAPKAIIVTSPDGRVKAELSAAEGALRYRIIVDGKQVLAPSKIGILSGGVELGQDAVLGKPQFRKVNEQYKFFGASTRRF